MSSTAQSLQGETDASVWARVFAETIAEHPGVPHDEETMLGWFANAIMAGADTERRKHLDRQRKLEEARILLAEMSVRIGQLVSALDPESPTAEHAMGFIATVMLPGMAKLHADDPIVPADVAHYFTSLAEIGVTFTVDG